MPNRLAHEPSLYLRQHADNPVDWYPWGEEAWGRARDEDRPVMISVGYSACHWCHVMAHESFEDEETAALLNALFVNIKVDRDERPDVDALYMQATVSLTGHGGWPMTVFCAPDGWPFFAGTYFPPEPRGGLPAFGDLARGVAHSYRTQRDEVSRQADVVMERIVQTARRDAPADVALDDGFVTRCLAALEDRFDPVYGGFGGAPKFPPSTALELLTHRLARTPDDTAVRLMLELTLTRMAEGGVYDHLGGGFHRYAVDGVWGVPHFEKMLYDNALLAAVYARAHALLGDAEHARTATETLEYLLREMRLEGGAFASAQDADTPDGEGAYFTWTPAEVDDALDQDAAAIVKLHYGIGDDGPVDGRCVLAVRRPIDALAELTRTDARATLQAAKPALAAVRSARTAPVRDDTVIAGWNGLAIAALADAGLILGRADFLDAARDAADFVLRSMVVDGELRRTHRDGAARHQGQLDDHAHLAHGLVRLHQATLEPRWIREAEKLARVMVERFGDDDQRGFHRAPRDGDPLVVARTRDLEDHPAPSGNSQAARVLAQLGAIVGDPALTERARRAVTTVAGDALRFPHAFGTAILTADLLAHADPAVAISGDPSSPAGAALVAVARAEGGPGAVVVAGDPDAALLRDRPEVDGAPAAYVCHGTVCQAPVTAPGDLRAVLGRGEETAGV